MTLFNHRRPFAVATVAWMLTCVGGSTEAEAVPIGVGAFGSGAILQDYNGLGLPMFPTFNPTPLVIGGNTYTGSFGVLWYGLLGGQVSCNNSGSASECLASPSQFGFIDVTFATPVLRAGAYFGSVSAGWSATVSFFDQADDLLETIAVTGSSSIPFTGVQADSGLIKRIRFQGVSSSGGAVFPLDDLYSEVLSVPEPSTLLLLGTGVFAVGLRKRRTAGCSRATRCRQGEDP